MSIEDIEVAPPKAHEVRIQILNTGVCHTGVFLVIIWLAFLIHVFLYKNMALVQID